MLLQLLMLFAVVPVDLLNLNVLVYKTEQLYLVEHELCIVMKTPPSSTRVVVINVMFVDKVRAIPSPTLFTGTIVTSIRLCDG